MMDIQKSASRKTWSISKLTTLVSIPMIAVALASCSGTDSGANGGESGSSVDGVQELRSELQDLLTDDMKGSLADLLPASYADADALVMTTDATVGIPVASFDENNEFIEGFAVDIGQAIGWMLGKDVAIEHSVWDGIIPGIDAGRYDFSISIMLDTQTRQEKVDFVDFLEDGSSILVAVDSDLENLSVPTLCGLGVGVMRGSYEEGLVTDQNETCSAEEQIDVQVYGGLNEAMLAVQSGRIDAMMGAASQLSYVETISAGKLKNAGGVVDPGIDGIAMAKGSELVNTVHAVMTEMLENGVYEEILKLSGVEQNALSEITINLESV